MNYKNLKITKNFPKVVKNLTVCAVLILSFLAIFSSKESSSGSLPDCSTKVSSDAKPGYNCFFVADKPLCQNIATATYSIPSSNYLTSGQVHRENCYDLSDMPLCRQLREVGKDEQDIKSGLNCATECNLIDPLAGSTPANRGITYAVHNRDCVRFCDSVDSENTARGSSIAKTAGVDCVIKKCHQLISTVAPVKNTNCNQIACNLLLPDELHVVSKMISDAKTTLSKTQNYCDGAKDVNDRTLKCYKFSQEQLPYVAPSKMCVIHSCKPSCIDSYIANTDVNGDGTIQSTVKSVDSDDTLNIFNKYKTDTSDAAINTANAAYNTSYAAKYRETINFGLDISSNFCTAVTCKPVVKKSFRCTDSDGVTITGEDGRDVNKNIQCDSSGTGSTCVNNYCYKTIDCNQNSNSALPECETSDDGSVGSYDDNMDSWFYRPKPMNKAIGTNGTLRTKIEEGLCYDKDDLEYYSVHGDEKTKWGARAIIKMGTLGFDFDMGYFLTYVSPNTTKSPGLCNKGNDGTRGIGYLFLCGNEGDLYKPLKDYTAFHKGYVETTFKQTDKKDDANHKVVVCLRFKNSMRPSDFMEDSETCGSRECGISCSWDDCTGQTCGYDVCKELTITDLDPKQCEMSNSLEEPATYKGDTLIYDPGTCMGTIDGGRLRLRIQKYGNRICSYLDAMGHTSYQSARHLFANGSERLEDGKTCVSGSSSASSGLVDCDGKDSTESPGSTSKWRTMKLNSNVHIPYIQNNQPSGQPRGYVDRDGAFFAEQECIQTSLRLPPPSYFKIANSKNSPKLFIPPIFIKNSLTKKDSGIISLPTGDNDFGLTDFNYPEIEISFGSTVQKLSLDIGYNGYEGKNSLTEDSKSKATITTSLNSISYSADVFMRKEFNRTDSTPIFCLYQKIKDSAGTELEPKRIGCVKRKFPEINSPSLKEKIKIYPDAAKTFSSAKIKLKYSSFGTNGNDESCAGDDVCSSEVSLENIDTSKPTCNEDANNNLVEGYKVCAQREKCTELNNECMKNEIDMQTAKLAGNSIYSYLLVRKNCNEVLLPRCNKKMGATTSSAALSILDDFATRSGNAHGWFNEICFVAGSDTKSFSNRLKQVVAYKLQDGLLGKCVIDTIKSLNGADCTSGGKAPNCICSEYVDGVRIDSDKESRLETPHEAGLCVDIPLPQTCIAIKYTETLNSNKEDLYYVDSSLASSLSSFTNIDKSHIDRTNGISSEHAEFPKSVFGTSSIEGTCRGFWKNNDSGGFSKAPNRNCLNNSGVAAWDSTIENGCIRYSCPAISTSGANAIGDYLDGYGSGYQDDNRGIIDGYATWGRYTKTSDYPEIINALGCIVGYKKVNSSPVLSGAVITDYSGGNPPSRVCNQIGQWKNTNANGYPDNSCVRITCPAVSPPRNPTTSSDWAQWYASGGATFPEIKASISNYAITPGSITTGTCNGNIGFFQTPGSNPPTRTCDHFGNWSEVSNKCTTRCEAISGTAAADSNNGFSYWPQTDITIGTESVANSTGCISGYVPYPYPPLKDSDGKAYTLSDSSPDYTSKIPLTVANDLRTNGFNPSLPKRKCKSVTFDGTSSNLWYSASSSCINKCPGATSDSRIGVGFTKHNIRGNQQISVSWPSANFDSWIYVTAIGNSIDYSDAYLNGQDASTYSSSNRNNGYYLLARKCGADGKWEDPIPQCATKGGQIGDSFATYSSESRTGSRSVNVGSTISGSTGGVAQSSTCISGYYKTRSNQNDVDISSYTCEYADGSKNIDQTYFKKKEGENCKLYCSIATNQEISNAKYTGTANNRVEIGATITGLSCKTGYGKKLLASGTDSVGDNSCDIGGGGTNQMYWFEAGVHFDTIKESIKSYDRSSTLPSITCQDNGTWSVSNDCSACRGCDENSLAATNTKTNVIWCKVYHGDKDSTYSFNKIGHSSNNNTITFGLFRNKSNTSYSTPHGEDTGCMGAHIKERSSHASFRAKCVDNKFALIQASCGEGSSEVGTQKAFIFVGDDKCY